MAVSRVPVERFLDALGHLVASKVSPNQSATPSFSHAAAPHASIADLRRPPLFLLTCDSKYKPAYASTSTAMQRITRAEPSRQPQKKGVASRTRRTAHRDHVGIRRSHLGTALDIMKSGVGARDPGPVSASIYGFANTGIFIGRPVRRVARLGGNVPSDMHLISRSQHRRKIMCARRLTAGVLLVLGTICLGGCLPDHLIWLPDSSGFVFTAGTGRNKIVRYDVRQRRRASSPTCHPRTPSRQG